MQNKRNRPILLAIVLASSSIAWGQGGRNQAGRGAPASTAQQPGGAAAQGNGGRGRGGAAAGASGATGAASSNAEFFNFDTSAASGIPIPDSPPVETQQKITVNGQALAYTARAGFMPLHNATTGQSEAHLFYTSYSKQGESAVRPLLFFVGGAPGYATSWQEFGGFGPKRLRQAGEGGAGPSVENPGTLLSQADLVFVNPVGTAFSRPDQPSAGPQFWNTAADIASLGEFVRTYLVRNSRSASPLFLAGEDRVTGRVAGLAAYLNDHHIPVRGVVLLSMAVSADSQAGDTQYLTLLPSLIMAAWHHKKLAPELSAMSAEQIAGQARQLASREYLHALYKGDRMTADERAKIVADLSRMTGVSKSFFINNDLRVSLERFNTELMREEHRGMSYSDARVTGFLPMPAAAGRGGGGGGGFGTPASTAIDFNMATLANSFQGAYEDYLQHELTFTGGGMFYLTNGGVPSFTSTGNDDASLSAAFAHNPDLKLFVGVDYFDLNTPFYATEYTLAHLNISPEVRAHNITVSHLEAGQMPYADPKALAKLQKDLASFVTETTAAHK